MQRLVVQAEQVIDTDPASLQLLPEQEHYLRVVLRLRAGDVFMALLVTGECWRAELSPEPAQACLREQLPALGCPRRLIQLWAALPKQGFDDVIRQATELGVSTIAPLQSERSLLRPSDRKQDRWQRLAIEATEQCERATPPVILPVRTWTSALQDLSLEEHQPPIAYRYIGVARQQGLPLTSCLQQITDPQVAIAIAIGPEGGWTDPELNQALAAGFQPVSLGPFVLRAVTAAIAALAIIQAWQATTESEPERLT